MAAGARLAINDAIVTCTLPDGALDPDPDAVDAIAIVPQETWNSLSPRSTSTTSTGSATRFCPVSDTQLRRDAMRPVVQYS